MQNSMVVFNFSVLYMKHPFLPSLWPYRSRDFEIGSCRQHGSFILLRWVRPWIVFVQQLLISHESIFILKNYKLPNLDWTFYVAWINLLLTIISVEIMKTVDKREMQKTAKEKQTKAEKSKGNRSYSFTTSSVPVALALLHLFVTHLVINW